MVGTNVAVSETWIAEAALTVGDILAVNGADVIQFWIDLSIGIVVGLTSCRHIGIPWAAGTADIIGTGNVLAAV